VTVTSVREATPHNRHFDVPFKGRRVHVCVTKAHRKLDHIPSSQSHMETPTLSVLKGAKQPNSQALSATLRHVTHQPAMEG